MASQSLPIDFTNCLFLGDGDLFAVDSEGLAISALMALSPPSMHRIEVQHVRGSLGAALDFVDVHDLQVRVPANRKYAKKYQGSAPFALQRTKTRGRREQSFSHLSHMPRKDRRPIRPKPLMPTLIGMLLFRSEQLDCLTIL